VTTHSILWRGFYLPGHKACQLRLLDSQWYLAGAALFLFQRQPCRLDYRLVCDSGWRTQAGELDGWLGERETHIELEPLHQIYQRLDESTYHNESGGGGFVADLQLNATGFVTNYPGIWQAEATS
jgi:hypothetical protein